MKTYKHKQLIPYSQLFWQALKLANWSKNVIGEVSFNEYVCATRDPVAQYYARDYTHRARTRELADLILAI